MSGDFCGAWSLSGKPLAELLPDIDRGKMKAACGGPGGEKLEGPLWLASDPAAGFQSPRAGDGHYSRVVEAAGGLDLERDATGGERLLYARLGELLLFSSAARPLLAHPRVRPVLHEGIALERALSTVACFGQETLWAGISEVLPGHRLRVRDGSLSHEWASGALLESLEGDPGELSLRMRVALREAVSACIGSDRRVAVSLSGGIDSAAIAALAAEVVGPENVHAFTYEYDTSAQPSETSWAALTASRLRLGSHRTLTIRREDCVRGGLRLLDLSEDILNWTKGPFPRQAEQLSENGFDKILTGDGVGSRMAWIEDLSWLLAKLPARRRALSYWKRAWARGSTFSSLAAIVPGLEPPNDFLYFPVLALLEQRGLMEGVEDFFPGAPRAAVRGLLDSERVRAACEELRELSLASALKRLTFCHLNSSVDISRPEAAMRRLGIARLSPFMFASCLPFAYLPPRPRPFVWSARRRMRPGKELLALAAADLVPPEIARRPKIWGQAVPPFAWRRADASPRPSRRLPAMFYEGAWLCRPMTAHNIAALDHWAARFLNDS